MRRRGVAASLALVLAAGIVPVAVRAQSVLDHPPDLAGTWTGDPGTLYFDLDHRFKTVGGSANKVVNSPTFLLGESLPGRMMVGFRYATNSLLVSGRPNEFEYFARWEPLMQAGGAPADVALHGGYNDAARSWDGEVTLARRLGPLRVLGVGRAFSAFRDRTARAALGGGFTLRLNRFVALAGDATTLVHRHANEEIAWSAGLQLAIPYTPHTLSINVSNANTTTLEGASYGVPQGRRWGFEFTIPIVLSRYFGHRERPTAATPSAEPGPRGPIGAEVHLTNLATYVPDTVRIDAGQMVLWINGSQIDHTVTDDPRLAKHARDARLPAGAAPFDSGDLAPGAVFEHTFRVPGVYHYFCQPHELDGMLGTVIVR